MNRIQRFPGFVYDSIELCTRRQQARVEITIKHHRAQRGQCSVCRRKAPGYDCLPERSWLFVPLWGLPTYFLYAPRRVQCPEHGVIVEHVPWSEGKRPITLAMMCFLARWARQLSWRQTARSFRTSWEAVYRWPGSKSWRRLKRDVLRNEQKEALRFHKGAEVRKSSVGAPVHRTRCAPI